MLTSFFLVSKPFYIHWEEKFLSVHAKFEKNSQCWQVFYLSGNDFLIFFLENLYFSIPLTGKVSVSNRKLQPFTAGSFWVWQVFFLSVHEFSLLFGKPDKHFACQLIFLWLVDKQKACQCSFSTIEKKKACQLDSRVTVTSFLLVSGWSFIYIKSPFIFSHICKMSSAPLLLMVLLLSFARISHSLNIAKLENPR